MKVIPLWGILALVLSLPVAAETVSLRVIETTDLHANMMDYDYYRDAPSARIGLVRAATLVERARAEVPNSVLVDNGDLIQGSPLGDYVAEKGLDSGETHPIYQAMNRLDYQVGNIGNHEFNYGLPFLMASVAGADFPYISANVLQSDTKEPLFEPYLVETRSLVDENGQPQPVTIGYIGFVPPQIMVWDKKHLEGQVIAQDIVQSARRWIPEMKAAGADVVIAIPHSGLSVEPYRAMAEDSVYYLSEVPGVDAIAFGHAHAVFPGEDFADLPGVDVKTGTINGVPAVMPGRWGSHVGVIDLRLQKTGGRWQVVSGRAEARPIFDEENQRPAVPADSSLASALKDAHQKTRRFVNRPIGKAGAPMYSYLALIQDDPTVQVVNDAQRDYVEHFIQGDPDLAQLPVLSASAPFKAGGRGGRADSYVKVDAGELSYRHAADLYPYPNTLVALKLTGSQIREWLECSAALYHRIDPTLEKPQPLIDWEGFRTYNFDVIDGVEYQFDVTQPARYNGECELINENAKRVVGLTYKGKPLDDQQLFLLATNNYRAYGEKFAGAREENVAFDAPDENRTILARYLGRVTREQGQFDPSADHNWSLAPIKAEPARPRIVWTTADSAEARAFIQAKARYPVTRLDSVGAHAARYELNLSSGSSQ